MWVEQLANFYSMPCRIFVGGVPQIVTIRWYKAPAGAKQLPIPTCFFSLVWEERRGRLEGQPGELGFPRTWDAGRNPGYQGQCYRGDPSWFATGQLPANVLDLPLGPCACQIPPATGSGGLTLSGSATASFKARYAGQVAFALAAEAFAGLPYAGHAAIAKTPSSRSGIPEDYAGEVALQKLPAATSGIPIVAAGEVAIDKAPSAGSGRPVMYAGDVGASLIPSAYGQAVAAYHGQVLLQAKPDAGVQQKATYGGTVRKALGPAAAAVQLVTYAGVVPKSLTTQAGSGEPDVYGGVVSKSLTPLAGSGFAVFLCGQCPGGAPMNWDVMFEGATGAFVPMNGTWTVPWVTECSWSAMVAGLSISLSFIGGAWVLSCTGSGFETAYALSGSFNCLGPNAWTLSRSVGTGTAPATASTAPA